MLKILNLLLYNTLKIFVTDTFFVSLLKNLHGSRIKYYENVYIQVSYHSNLCTLHAFHWSSLLFSYQFAKCRYNKNVYISVLLYKRIIFQSKTHSLNHYLKYDN